MQASAIIRLATIALLTTMCSECVAQSSLKGARVSESPRQISILVGDKLALSYNKKPPTIPDGIDPIYKRSGFLHPVKNPAGDTLTDVYPADHAHQNGVFSAWVNTTYRGKKVDFWNVAAGKGHVAHLKTVGTFADNERVGFTVDLVHRSIQGKKDEAVDVLVERWTVTLVEATTDYFCFDIEAKQQALTDDPLTVNKYHYGGMAFRGRENWLFGDKDLKNAADQEASIFLNDNGSGRIAGNHQESNWVMLSGETEHGKGSICVMSHPSNFRSPQRARLHPNKPYFVYSPCVDESFTIDKDHPLDGKYRYYIYNGVPTASQLSERFQQWVQ